MKRHMIRTLFAAAFLSLTALSFAYPPDNAALIYYKCMVNFNLPEDPLGDQLRDAAKGEIEVNDQIQQYLKEKKLLINALQTASEIPTCDWGLDFSQGLALELPYLATMRQFTYIMLADAQLKKQEGQSQEAMNQCLVVLRMAGHVGNDTFISYLVGTAMSTLTYDAMGDVLSAMPPDKTFLIELQRELKLPEYNVLNIKTPLLNESRYMAAEILRLDEKKEEILKQLDPPKEIQKDLLLLLEADPEFLQASADYYQQFFDLYMDALDLPYEQALEKFDALENKPQQDYEAGKKEAFASCLLAPATTKVYGIDIRRRTHQNAIYTALEVYRYYALKGALPPKLPPTAPKDLYSGRPFAYEPAAEGFILRCNEKDRSKDQIWEYDFQIAE